ncbi:secretion-regulating guanine nucleotide exchange factor [Bacillus rossius redtenbacheri]|uniref:secretion-regulating guanine nucleotide exchange factor n=1 Tax=Bacillus rossius redtenbacheri TaxID=93214 RepID=UPI002FDDCE3B
MKLFSWGANSHGQLGLAVDSEQCVLPREVHGLEAEQVDQVVGGGGHTLVLTRRGHVLSCGWNAAGQLGCGHCQDLNVCSPVAVMDVHAPRMVACGWDWSAAVTARGHLLTWGSNAYCQLGVQSESTRVNRPQLVPGTPSLRHVACGLRHMAAVTEDGRVLVWGSSRHEALGIVDAHGLPARRLASPTEVPGLEGAVRVACGQHHTAALTSDGRVYVWGDNRHGQLGLDPSLHRSVAVPLQLDLSAHPRISARSLLLSGSTHSAVVTDDGSVVNWGRNCYGQLGFLQQDRPEPWKPQVLHDLGRVSQLAVGSEHNVALLESGRIMSWGWNEHGNCGTGTVDVWRPRLVSPDRLKDVVCIGSGYGHSFAMASS